MSPSPQTTIAAATAPRRPAARWWPLARVIGLAALALVGLGTLAASGQTPTDPAPAVASLPGPRPQVTLASAVQHPARSRPVRRAPHQPAGRHRSTHAPHQGSPAHRGRTGVARKLAANAPTVCPGASALEGAGATTLSAEGARYGISGLWAAGETGRGVTIATVEFGASSPSDVAAYDRCFGLPATGYQVVPIDGGGASGSAFVAEADLDIEQLQTQAPGATIVSYEAPDTNTSWTDVLSAIVSADQAKVISISWGLCEAAYAGGPSGTVAPIDALLAKAAAQGQSVVVASGDRGAQDCYDSANGTGAGTLAVDFPASDPNVTAVGGTDVSPAGEQVWNAALQAGASGASGGGVSADFAEPSWQQAVAGTLAGSCGASGCRGIPDLSLDANGLIFFGGGSLATGSGTSFSAPFVAAMTADLQSACATPIGNLAPRLYAWDQIDPGAFVPVTSGSNDYTGASGATYSASAGYNLATGLGTPVASALSCPQVHALSPTTAPAGATVTITGAFLGSASVTFGQRAASIVSRGANQLVATVPPGSGTVAVTVSNPTGAAASKPFAYAP
ncbi:MAG: S8 family serine peptidase [Actinomycetota bacterium]|nr:S8 family serine peptidase [Actinomycetota bacterium]